MGMSRPQTLTRVEQGSYTFEARTGERFTIRRVRGDARNSFSWVARGDKGTCFDLPNLDDVRAHLRAAVSAALITSTMRSGLATVHAMGERGKAVGYGPSLTWATAEALERRGLLTLRREVARVWRRRGTGRGLYNQRVAVPEAQAFLTDAGRAALGAS
jgi:hypothetical protein